MKRKTDPLTRLLIFNALFLALSIMITINLWETGGRETAPQSTPALTQSAG